MFIAVRCRTRLTIPSPRPGNSLPTGEICPADVRRARVRRGVARERHHRLHLQSGTDAPVRGARRLRGDRRDLLYARAAHGRRRQGAALLRRRHARSRANHPAPRSRPTFPTSCAATAPRSMWRARKRAGSADDAVGRRPALARLDRLRDLRSTRRARPDRSSSRTSIACARSKANSRAPSPRSTASPAPACIWCCPSANCFRTSTEQPSASIVLHLRRDALTPEPSARHPQSGRQRHAGPHHQSRHHSGRDRPPARRRDECATATCADDGERHAPSRARRAHPQHGDRHRRRRGRRGQCARASHRRHGLQPRQRTTAEHFDPEGKVVRSTSTHGIHRQPAQRNARKARPPAPTCPTPPAPRPAPRRAEQQQLEPRNRSTTKSRTPPRPP